MSTSSDNIYKTFVLSAFGIFLVILGITLVLTFWENVVSLFKGISGIVVSIAGLTILYFLSNQKK